MYFFFFFQAEDGIRDDLVTGVQTCALPISAPLRQLRQASHSAVIFQPELETMPVQERAELQRARLAELVERLQRADGYWREKLDDVLPGDDIERLPFTTKQELLDQYPYGLLA